MTHPIKKFITASLPFLVAGYWATITPKAWADAFIFIERSSGYYDEKPRVRDGKYQHIDPSIGAVYKIMPGDSLSKIVDTVYYGTNLKPSYLMQYVVKRNKHAFGGGQARYMFAGANLTVPSTAEIESSIYKNSGMGGMNGTGRNAIYFP